MNINECTVCTRVCPSVRPSVRPACVIEKHYISPLPSMRAALPSLPQTSQTPLDSASCPTFKASLNLPCTRIHSKTMKNTGISQAGRHFRRTTHGLQACKKTAQNAVQQLHGVACCANNRGRAQFLNQESTEDHRSLTHGLGAAPG